MDISHLREGGYGQNYSRGDGEAFTEEDREWLRGYYDGMIRDADDRIGELMAKLEELSLLDNTLILITADHGQLIGEDGHTVAHRGDTDQNVHVPLILHGPGIPAGKQVDVLTEHVDLVPTLTDLLDLSTDATFDGHSLRPFVDGVKPDIWRDHVFMIPDRANYEEPTGFSLRGKSLKYLFDQEGSLVSVMKSPDREAKRIDLTVTHGQNGALMEKELKDFFLPRLRAMQEAPVQRIVLEGAWLANFGTPEEAVEDYYITGEKARADLERDNKWAYTDGFLWAMHGTEKVPHLSYVTKAPKGLYTARAFLWNSLNFQGKPASALSIQFTGDDTPRHAACASLPDEEAGLSVLSLGSVTVEDELKISLLPSELPWWTRLFSLELIPETTDSADPTAEEIPVLSPEDADELNEMIKSAGYM
jgi:hypothetical protein